MVAAACDCSEETLFIRTSATSFIELPRDFAGAVRQGAIEACTYLVVMARNRGFLLLMAWWYSYTSTLFPIPTLFVE